MKPFLILILLNPFCLSSFSQSVVVNSGGFCYSNDVANLNGTFNGKNRYTGTDVLSGGTFHVRWDGTQWEVFHETFGQDATNSSNSSPNPPCTGLGTWVSTFCDPLTLTSTNGGCQAAPLPVELVFFEGTSENFRVQLNWQTASETNNESFDIQRSADGKTWDNLAFVPGHGTTNEEQSYTYTDERPLPGLNYYRLKQMDYDGKFEYSQIVSVEVERDGKGFDLFPNPVTGSVTLALESDYAGEATLTLYDLLGKQMKTQVLSLEGGSFRTSIGLDGLPDGVYLVAVVAGREQWRERLVVE